MVVCTRGVCVQPFSTPFYIYAVAIGPLMGRPFPWLLVWQLVIMYILCVDNILNNRHTCTARYMNRMGNKYSGYKHWMIAHILVGEFMQNHMFRVPDGLLCRHGWSPSHSHLLAFSTVVSPWWPWLPNGVGQMKYGIWSNGGLVRMTSFSCRTGCQQFSWNRWYTLWPYLQWTQKPGGWRLHAQLLAPSQHTPVSFPICAFGREREMRSFGGRRGRSGRKP